jgi:hypothetical protein
VFRIVLDFLEFQHFLVVLAILLVLRYLLVRQVQGFLEIQQHPEVLEDQPGQ